MIDTLIKIIIKIYHHNSICFIKLIFNFSVFMLLINSSLSTQNITSDQKITKTTIKGKTNKATTEKVRLKEQMNKEIPIISNRKIFDFFIEIIDPDIPCIIWSEYDVGNDKEVTINSSFFKDKKWKEPEVVYRGKYVKPDIKIAMGFNNEIHILMGRERGGIDELNIITYDGTGWNPPQKILNAKTRTFGYSIAASKFKKEIYVVFGDYSERYYFPYIFTAPLSGHVCKDFGKLFLIKGDGFSWQKPIRITDKGKFSSEEPNICLNDQKDVLHIVWVDHRYGFRNRAIYYDSFMKNRLVRNIELTNHEQLIFSPVITSNPENSNIIVAWSILGEDGLGKLFCRERSYDKWLEAVELSEKGLMNDMTFDYLGNVHSVCSDNYNIYYQQKIKDAWIKALKLDASRAKLSVDMRNDIHLVVRRKQENGQCSLVYLKLKK